MTMERQDELLTFVTGIKPTGRPHLGNYLGCIRPALEMAIQHRAFYFIADAHALTTIRNPGQLTEMVLEVAAAWKALGLDPERIVFYRQSAVPEVFELAWILACSKEALHAVLIKRFGTVREHYLDLLANPQTIYRQLDDGSAKAREIARHALSRVRQAVGIGEVLEHPV